MCRNARRPSVRWSNLQQVVQLRGVVSCPVPLAADVVRRVVGGGNPSVPRDESFRREVDGHTLANDVDERSLGPVATERTAPNLIVREDADVCPMATGRDKLGREHRGPCFGFVDGGELPRFERAGDVVDVAVRIDVAVPSRERAFAVVGRRA